jgi:hypothetical protein
MLGHVCLTALKYEDLEENVWTWSSSHRCMLNFSFSSSIWIEVVIFMLPTDIMYCHSSMSHILDNWQQVI